MRTHSTGSRHGYSDSCRAWPTYVIWFYHVAVRGHPRLGRRKPLARGPQTWASFSASLLCGIAALLSSLPRNKPQNG